MNGKNKKFRLRFTSFPVWACFDGGGAGAGDGAGVGAGSGGTGAGGAGSGGAGAAGRAGDDSKSAAITFPDEASFHARLKREGKAQLEALAKELGFESVEAMQTAAKAKKEADDASKSEAEKEKARADKAEADKKTAMETANTRLMNADIKVFAAQAGFADPSDAVALVDRADIKVDDAGSVTGAKEAVEALAKAKPHLLGKAGGTGGSGNIGGSANPGGGGGGGDDNSFGANLGKKQKEQAAKNVKGQELYFK